MFFFFGNLSNTCSGCLEEKKYYLYQSNCYNTYSTFQGLRPDLPENAHPKILDLMQRCWDAVPGNRPSFSEIKLELEVLFQEVQVEISEYSIFILYNNTKTLCRKLIKLRVILGTFGSGKWQLNSRTHFKVFLFCGVGSSSYRGVQLREKEIHKGRSFPPY